MKASRRAATAPSSSPSRCPLARHPRSTRDATGSPYGSPPRTTHTSSSSSFPPPLAFVPARPLGPSHALSLSGTPSSIAPQPRLSPQPPLLASEPTIAKPVARWTLHRQRHDRTDHPVTRLRVNSLQRVYHHPPWHNAPRLATASSAPPSASPIATLVSVLCPLPTDAPRARPGEILRLRNAHMRDDRDGRGLPNQDPGSAYFLVPRACKRPNKA
ncbi:hypothetical protein C8Q79DRAFT_89143 [Trametes meyenii]|nr:hypothetical protein C8Q79DRAFT_89143 [Trametes meyenii]